METVLITGCSTGIGRVLAQELQQSGYKVWATARKIESLAELETSGIRAACLDITNSEQVESVVTRILDEDGKIDILINNAGYGAMGPLSETPKSEFLRQFDTNVLAQMELSNAVIPHMQKQGCGAIINIGSVSGLVTTPFSGSYCASKAAFNALSDTMRMELKPFGIKVLTVMPGAIRSDFARNANQALERVFAEDSRYMPIEEGVRDRANASQQFPTPAEKVAVAIRQWLGSSRKQGIMKIGNGSRVLPLLKMLLPNQWFEAVLGRKFRLNQLRIR